MFGEECLGVLSYGNCPRNVWEEFSVGNVLGKILWVGMSRERRGVLV